MIRRTSGFKHTWKMSIHKIISCEHCKAHCTSKNDMKGHMEKQKVEQNELQNSQENSNKNIEEQMAAFEKEKPKYIQSYKDIEQLLKKNVKKTCAMTLRMRRFIVRAKAKNNLIGNICCCVSSPPLHWIGNQTSLSVYTLINK